MYNYENVEFTRNLIRNVTGKRCLKLTVSSLCYAVVLLDQMVGGQRWPEEGGGSRNTTLSPREFFFTPYFRKCIIL